MMKALIYGLAVAGMVFFAGSSLAMAQSGGDSVSYKKKTIIDLTGTTIEGELVKPEGQMITHRKLSRFSALVKPRPDFWFELEFSGADL